MTLYERLVAAEAEIDNHESDLYVKETVMTARIVRSSGFLHTRFVSETDNQWWIEVPFMFDPWWEKRRPPTAKTPIPEFCSRPECRGLPRCPKDPVCNE
jgi:hypothetical protein